MIGHNRVGRSYSIKRKKLKWKSKMYVKMLRAKDLASIVLRIYGTDKNTANWMLESFEKFGVKFINYEQKEIKSV